MSFRESLRRLLVVAATVVASGSAVGAPDSGPPRRVASLNLSSDEILVEILPPERLVSVTRWADAPGTSNVVGRVPAAAYRFQKADMEQLVALAPTSSSSPSTPTRTS